MANVQEIVGIKMWLQIKHIPQSLNVNSNANELLKGRRSKLVVLSGKDSSKKIA